MGNGMLSLSKGMNIFGSKPNNFVIYEYKEFFFGSIIKKQVNIDLSDSGLLINNELLLEFSLPYPPTK